MPDFDVFSLLEIQKRKRRSHGKRQKGNDKRKRCAAQKDRSVTSSIPNYFQNSDPPIICYKYNKPIRHTIFNFNKLVSDLDIHANTPSS